MLTACSCCSPSSTVPPICLFLLLPPLSGVPSSKETTIVPEESCVAVKTVPVVFSVKLATPTFSAVGSDVVEVVVVDDVVVDLVVVVVVVILSGSHMVVCSSLGIP